MNPSIYTNTWAHLASQDDDRTDVMLYEETDLAMNLHFKQFEQVRTANGNSWVPGYLEELKSLLEEELKAASRLRRCALDRGNPPAYVSHVHRHRRRLACVRQEMDLIEQAFNDAASGEDIQDMCIYLKHAIQSGSAIITGARSVVST